VSRTSGCSAPRLAGKRVATAISIFLVDIDADRSLFDLVCLGQNLEDLLGHRVDVFTPASIHPRREPASWQTFGRCDGISGVRR
jgi:hypothetical protein